MTLAALFLTALLFGGMVLYSFGLAPLVFSQLPATTAGKVLRAAFPRYYLFVIVAAIAASVPLTRLDPLAAGLMTATALIGIVARQILMPRINVASDTGARGRFKALHGVSVALNFVQLAAVAWVLARFL